MAGQISIRDIAPVLRAAEQWIESCLVEDGSVFSNQQLWTPKFVDEVNAAFVENPDYGDDDFLTKLKGQMARAAAPAQRLMAEMLWALLLFPSNMKARTKRQQIREIWGLTGQRLAEEHPQLTDSVLVGIGSGGPGFNNYRPEEMTFLIALARDLKRRDKADRKRILSDYVAFTSWIGSVPQPGKRQYRHMIRYFAFPDRVERMSSNTDRRRILEAMGVAATKEIKLWSDQALDDAMLNLRSELQSKYPGKILDFYEPPLRELWAPERKVKTVEGDLMVVVPTDEDDQEEADGVEAQQPADSAPVSRKSLQVQAKVAEIGIKIGLRVWVPRADKGRILELLPASEHAAFLERLPLNYDEATLDTIEQIDVLWLKNRTIVRAFEIEHTTAVYSGLLRMADLLALQPNLDIRLHIVAPDERKEKVFREMQRPVFSLLDRGPLSNCCTFLSYESVFAIGSLEHLAHINQGIITKYEEPAE